MKLPRKSMVSYLATLCYGTALVIPSLSWPASAFAEAGARDKEIRRFNIKSTTPLLPATYQGDALVSQGLIKESGQPATPIVMDYLAQRGQQWLNQLGRAKIAMQGDTLRSLQGQAALLLPIQQNEQWLWFAQGGWVQSKQGSTLSLGTGQRQFYSKQGYWGNNLFFDYQSQGNHYRLGLGLEQGYQAFSSQINGYLPLSDPHLINNSADQANPARGIDVRLRYQPPQWPHWRLGITGDHYWGTIARSSSLVENPTTLMAGIHYTPIPLVVLGYHLRWNISGKLVHQLRGSLNYRLGVPWEQQVDRQQVVRQLLEVDRLKLVSRHHEMVLQQQPNDEIKLEIENLSPGEQTPGSPIQVRVRVTTPRPLNEWQFSWVGTLVNTQLSLKEAEGNETLTLPNNAGTYMLQLRAYHSRGKVANSNYLTLHIYNTEQYNSSSSSQDSVAGNRLIMGKLSPSEETTRIFQDADTSVRQVELNRAINLGSSPRNIGESSGDSAQYPEGDVGRVVVRQACGISRDDNTESFSNQESSVQSGLSNLSLGKKVDTISTQTSTVSDSRRKLTVVASALAFVSMDKREMITGTYQTKPGTNIANMLALFEKNVELSNKTEEQKLEARENINKLKVTEKLEVIGGIPEFMQPVEDYGFVRVG